MSPNYQMSPQSTGLRGSAITQRKRKYSVRAFYATILVFSVIVSLVLLRDVTRAKLGRSHALWRRGEAQLVQLSGLAKRDKECRFVHDAVDKCAFVQSNCADEEAGLFSYLTLYYCKLPHVKAVTFTILVLWLALLFSTIGIAASDFFCINLSTISNILGMSESFAGVTFLAFGNGSPDVFSTFAAMSTNSGSLAVGELIGAASFITAVVAGSMALVRPFKVAKKSFVRDVGFFIVAVAFSMGFLADGNLHLWECAVMVGFYVFYVCFVVVWHWWLGRQLRRKRREYAARGQFYVPSTDELQVDEEANEDDAEEGQSLMRGHSIEDFAALEQGEQGSPRVGVMDGDDEDDDEARDRWLAEISSNMRIRQPEMGRRRSTFTPIRPSLVGALEFRAVLSSLQRSRNIQTIPINLRRYSDDPSYTAVQQQDQHSHLEVPTPSPNPHLLDEQPHDHGHFMNWGGLGDPGHLGGRARAVSANDATALGTGARSNRDPPQIDLLSSSPPGIEGSGTSTPHLSASPARRAPSPDFLAPPPEEHRAMSRPQQIAAESHADRTDSASTSPKSVSRQHPRLIIPHSTNASGSSTPNSPFPSFTDSPYPMSAHSNSRPPSIHLPPPSLSPDSSWENREQLVADAKPIGWWPYKVLPAPQVLAATLFPTLYRWREKTIWEKFIGVVAAPSVFLLSITLPVVESEKEPDPTDLTFESAVHTPRGDRTPQRQESSTSTNRDRASPMPASQPWLEAHAGVTNSIDHGNRNLSVPQVKDHYPSHTGDVDQTNNSGALHTNQPNKTQQKARAAQVPPPDPPASSPTEWNRWLLSVHIVTAPLFIVLVIWANTTPDPMKGGTLVVPVLSSLLASFVCLGGLMLVTTPAKPPKWRFLFCFLGFVVSITWISAIANEVVGVLKAIGVILGISDAILGLTIFAVGNSLGDLVADITVARLGYPVMALSAAFAGPQLNLMLGIGLSGLYLMIRDGLHKHDKHPDREIKYKPYQIEVSSTLMISAATLLATLVGLLFVVPWNNWRMDRKIGWGLVALWGASTVSNVLVEITGFGGRIS
ncbi:MAG: hypothetical protein M4579_002344 [Chaenotheca gracillima]|nr:MAG: hypothetical protein M4579_002344 [Chaenotheca gracillima]